MDSTPELGRITSVVQLKSKVLLGSLARVQVAWYLGVAENPFWARKIAQSLGLAENKISAELSRFAEQGLLVAMDAAATWDRRRLFMAAPGSETYWAMAEGLVRSAVDQVASETGRDADKLFDAYLSQIDRNDRDALERNA